MDNFNTVMELAEKYQFDSDRLLSILGELDFSFGFTEAMFLKQIRASLELCKPEEILSFFEVSIEEGREDEALVPFTCIEFLNNHDFITKDIFLQIYQRGISLLQANRNELIRVGLINPRRLLESSSPKPVFYEAAISAYICSLSPISTDEAIEEDKSTLIVKDINIHRERVCDVKTEVMNHCIRAIKTEKLDKLIESVGLAISDYFGIEDKYLFRKRIRDNELVYDNFDLEAIFYPALLCLQWFKADKELYKSAKAHLSNLFDLSKDGSGYNLSLNFFKHHVHNKDGDFLKMCKAYFDVNVYCDERKRFWENEAQSLVSNVGRYIFSENQPNLLEIKLETTPQLGQMADLSEGRETDNSLVLNQRLEISNDKSEIYYYEWENDPASKKLLFVFKPNQAKVIKLLIDSITNNQCTGVSHRTINEKSGKEDFLSMFKDGKNKETYFNGQHPALVSKFLYSSGDNKNLKLFMELEFSPDSIENVDLYGLAKKAQSRLKKRRGRTSKKADSPEVPKTNEFTLPSGVSRKK